MRRIWKYPFNIVGRVELELPVGGRVVHVGLDPLGIPCIWVDFVNEEKATRSFFIVGTGHPLPDRHVEHRGSFIESSFVWHLYEEVSF